MMLELPARPSTFSLSNSLVASEATCCGLVCSGSAMYSTGRPLMPPLSFTQSKTAFAVLVMSVKSTPGCFVMIAPILMASPEAFSPLPRPHFASAVTPRSSKRRRRHHRRLRNRSHRRFRTLRQRGRARTPPSPPAHVGRQDSTSYATDPPQSQTRQDFDRPYRQLAIDRNQLFRSPEQPACDVLRARSRLAQEERRPTCPTHHVPPRRAPTTWGACSALRSSTRRSNASTRRSTPRCSPRSASRT